MSSFRYSKVSLDANQLVASLIPTVTVIFAVGATYGMIRSNMARMTREIEKLNHDNSTSSTNEARQSIINSTISEEIETIKDRLDVHDMGLKNLELDVVKIKAKCQYFEDRE